MKKVFIAIGIAAIILLIVWHQGIASVLLSLLVTGHIPGTTLTIPFWGMMGIYCLLITAIVTYYIEESFAFHRDTKVTHARKSRMPRRRFGHI